MGNTQYIPTSTWENLEDFILKVEEHEYKISLTKKTYKLPEILIHNNIHITLVHPQNYRMDKSHISTNTIQLYNEDNRTNEISITTNDAFNCLKSLVDKTIKTDFNVDIKENNGIVSFVFGFNKFKSNAININTNDHIEDKKIDSKTKIKVLHPYTNTYVYLTKEELENDTYMLKNNNSDSYNIYCPTYDEVFSDYLK